MIERPKDRGRLPLKAKSTYLYTWRPRNDLIQREASYNAYSTYSTYDLCLSHSYVYRHAYGSKKQRASYRSLGYDKSLRIYMSSSGRYTTTITHPDATKAIAKLAQFLTNPSPQYHYTTDRALSYLYTTRYLAIEYC
ncbi:hypothetical protein N7476_005182 [Penicillium atrosanguineum]|uniref:Uncharacterized protein n=1 Tax=Penicillium atrosanguineum TaxID=1132637 RepID=A0A9W9PV57_9EURO|nr:hypothetical protein N7476_005182 [Penicillium atrosanguineum]